MRCREMTVCVIAAGLLLLAGGVADAGVVGTSTSFEAAEGYSPGAVLGQPGGGYPPYPDGLGWTTDWYRDGSPHQVVAGGAPGGGSQHMQSSGGTIRRELEEFTAGQVMIAMKVKLDGPDPWSGAEARFQLEETDGTDAIDLGVTRVPLCSPPAFSPHQ